MQIEKSSKPVRLSQLDKVVTTIYKPAANHQYNIEYERKKKEDGKQVQVDKQYVLDMLFLAFQFFKVIFVVFKLKCFYTSKEPSTKKWQPTK